MEMMHRDDRRDDYAFISGTRPQSWYSRYKRKFMWGGLAGLVIITIIVFIVAVKSKKETSDTPTENPEVFSIRWDEECPWEPEECPQSFQGRPPLLLVSLDGFRAEYLSRGFNPILKRISECGASAPHMFPVYPSKTFPNHFSIVTGLHPSSHGIIDNSMSENGRLFKPGRNESQDPFWWEKEPIWVTAVKQGLKSATFFWPGSDVKINGSYPTYYKVYNTDILFEERVDQVLAWLDLPEEERPSILTLYFNEPDSEGHLHGTNSKEVDAALVRVDGLIERLFAGLQQRNLTGCVNVMILSDHGMSSINCSKSVNIDKYINMSEVSSFLGSFGRLRLKESANTSEAQLLSELQCKSSHMRAYRKEQLPLRMHYSAHRRIEPIILELDSGWTVMDHEPTPGDRKCSGGAHGYDNMFTDMRALFIATGPSIKKNLTIDPFMNIELYELMCELLNITANPNNGTRGSLYDLLRDPVSLPSSVEPDPPITATVEQNVEEYETRVRDAQCPCSQTRKQEDLTDISEKKNYHLPFGVPSSGENDSLRLLYNNDYISAYHSDLMMPMWSSFTIQYKNITEFPKNVCWTGDARLYHDEIVRCSDYNTTVFEEENILQRPLYPEDFSDALFQEEARYITNSIPKSAAHVNSLEEKLLMLLIDKARRNGPLNVVMGPAFDLAGTEHKPNIEEFRKAKQKYGKLIVPTHIFVVATWCKMEVDDLQSCFNSSLDAHAFLLPNHPYPQACEPPSMVITRNVARVVDVETLTGLAFYTGLPQPVSIRLRTEVPQVRL